MPYEDPKLPQNHCKYQKERLDDHPDGIEVQHSVADAEMLSGI